MLQKRVNLFGLNIDDMSMDEALGMVRNALLTGEQSVFFTPNLEMLSLSRKNHMIKGILNSATACLPDGFGLRVVGFLLGRPIENTVPGIDLGKGALSIVEELGASVFLLGGSQGVAERAAKRIKREHPQINICGVQNGFFTPDDSGRIVEQIKRSGAQILIVCMGFPRQEKIVFEHKRELSSVNVFLCLGGSLDVWAGDVGRAPVILRRAHLEWLWRIACEPQRVKRFVRSLDTLFEAVAIFVRSIGMKGDFEAYNQTKPYI